MDKAQFGIGPVISAGIIANISFPEMRTASRLWRYARLDPTVE
jgi:hypothetical protein